MANSNPSFSQPCVQRAEKGETVEDLRPGNKTSVACPEIETPTMGVGSRALHFLNRAIALKTLDFDIHTDMRMHDYVHVAEVLVAGKAGLFNRARDAAFRDSSFSAFLTRFTDSLGRIVTGASIEIVSRLHCCADRFRRRRHLIVDCKRRLCQSPLPPVHLLRHRLLFKSRHK